MWMTDRPLKPTLVLVTGVAGSSKVQCAVLMAAIHYFIVVFLYIAFLNVLHMF